MDGRPVVAIAAAFALIALPSPALAEVSLHAPAIAPAAPGVATDAVPVPSGSSVADLAPATPMRLAFTLPFSNGSRLGALLGGLSDRSSAVYRHFASYPEFEREFRPMPSSVARVETALEAAGGTSVDRAPGGLGVDATLPASSVERLLGVRLVRYVAPGIGTGFTAVGPVSLPPALAGLVAGVDGLSGSSVRPSLSPTLASLTSARPAPGGLAQYVQGDGPDHADWFLGTDYAQAYEATALLPGNSSVDGATYPAGVAIATLLASGYNTTLPATLPPWDPAVVDGYFNDTFPVGWPHPTLTGIRVPESGPLPPLPGSFHGEGDSTGFEIENSLDLEMAGSLGPGSSLYNFYFSGALTENPATWANTALYLTDGLGEALAYNYSPARLAVVSCSFGLADLNDSLWNADLELAAATGVTVVAASGDQGDAPDALTDRGVNASPLWPATVAFNSSGAVSVGGVSIALSGRPTSVYTAPPLVATYDPNVEGIANASAWWDTSDGIGTFAGTEGGTSLIYAEPWWQTHSAADPPIVNATEVERFGRLGRAGPDVAFPANSTIAYVEAAANGTLYFAVVAGTSVAAPVFAGLLADVVAVENATLGGVPGLGFVDPELYRIASFYWTHPGSSDPFQDVVSGGNALFSAAPGWDATTGWGGLVAPLLLAALENASVAGYNYTGPTPSLPGPAAPPTPILTIVVILAAAAGVVVASSVALLAGRARDRTATFPPPSAYAGLSGTSPSVPPGVRGVATFACPTCGAERPAEPGHCPTCGAM